MEHEFRIDVTKREDVLRVEIVGELDLATASSLAETLDHADVANAKLLVIDLTGVSFIDSTGLRTLICAHQRLEPSPVELEITGVTEQARKLFEIAGVLEQLPITPAQAPL